MKRSIEENKRLCEEMHFLIPKNRWTGKGAEDYDYSFTELDLAEIPLGWDDLFFDFCKEITNVVGDKYGFSQVKEKYGSLRIYDFGNLKEGHTYEEYQKLKSKYVELSKHTCCKCGSTNAKMRNDAWICPWCDDCYENRRK